MASKRLVLLAESRRSVPLIVMVLLSIFRTSVEQACRTDQIRCDTGGCVNEDDICDYFSDCEDNSDERRCTYPPPDMTKALVCTMNSHVGPVSFIQKLFGDPDHYAYKLNNDTFADALPIHMNWLHIDKFDFVHALSIDYDTQRVYYTNNFNQRLEVGWFVYNNHTEGHYYYAVPDSDQMNGVAIDWVTKNIYWTDGRYKVIGVLPSAVAHRSWKAIVDRNLSSPQDIAVNPVLHYLFWSDGTDSDAKIERSDLSGNSRTVLVSSAQGLVSPTTLVVDFSSQKLYWLDSAAEKIGHVNFDGSEPFTQRLSFLSHVSAMTVYMNYIYFGNSGDPTISIYNKTSLNEISSYRLRGRGGITDMVMFASDVQPPADSPCTTNNGGCSQFCWTTSSTTRVCDCALGFYLAADGATCNSRPFPPDEEIHVVADFYKQTIYQLNPVSGEVRALPMSPCHPVSVAVDPSINGMYLTCVEEKPAGDQYQYRIRKKTFDGKVNQAIYNAPESTSESQLVGLALDAVRGLLYYTDKVQGIIAEITTSGTDRREIFNDRSQHPRAIVVDSKSRCMYWSDCSVPATIQTARIEDGGDRQILVSDYQHSCIVDIAVDFDNELMYWISTDNPAVEMASLNGSGQVTLLAESKASYTGITLYQDSLYISDDTRRNIIKFNVTSREMSLQLPGLFAHAYDIQYFDTDPGPPDTSTLSTSLSTSPGPTEGLPLIVIIAVGIGGVLVLLVIIITIVLICILCRKKPRPVEQRSCDTDNVFWTEPVMALPVLPAYDEIPATANGVNKPFHTSDYDYIHPTQNCYLDLCQEPPPPPAPTTDKKPPPPVKPKPERQKPNNTGENGDGDDDYLHFSP